MPKRTTLQRIWIAAKLKQYRRLDDAWDDHVRSGRWDRIFAADERLEELNQWADDRWGERVGERLFDAANAQRKRERERARHALRREGSKR